ncbi:MAG: penicillin-binding transpeptidase domain-containing protein [Nitriliruptoraceae bacterium]
MTTHMGRVGIFLLLFFGAVFIQLNVLTVFSSETLVNHPANQRVILREFGEARGPLVVDGDAIVSSVPSDGTFAFLRRYQDGELFAHITGYYSLVVQRSGLEAAVNDTLRGTPTEVINQNLAALFNPSGRGGNAVELTIDAQVQRAAQAALQGREGAIVVVEPTTGAVLASYANPTFDPAPLAGANITEVNDAWRRLIDNPVRPLVDRATAETYPPGSIFKLLVATAALETGSSPTDMFADVAELTVPGTTRPINNFPPGPCANGETISLTDAMVGSCNTVFVRLALDLGDSQLRAYAQRFGFNQRLTYDLPVAASVFPELADTPALAQSALGQRDVRMTALHAALMAATIVNDGVMPRAHLIRQVRDPNGRVIPPSAPRREPTAVMTAQTARQLDAMLVETVRRGTAARTQIAEHRVGGKTGTAQTATTPTVWFVGYVDSAAAIAVVLPHAGDGATGGSDATPIAREVLRAVINR